VEDRRYARIDAPYRRDDTVSLVAKDNVAGLVDASPDVERDVGLVDDPPLRPWRRPGSVS
jgi:hypothetical protein